MNTADLFLASLTGEYEYCITVISRYLRRDLFMDVILAGENQTIPPVHIEVNSTPAIRKSRAFFLQMQALQKNLIKKME
jgi:hypothetical protein